MFRFEVGGAFIKERAELVLGVCQLNFLFDVGCTATLHSVRAPSQRAVA